MIVRADFRRHFGGPLTATPRPPLTLSPAYLPLFPKSCQIISFADPHPLTPLESYRFKKGRGEVPGPSHLPVIPVHSVVQVNYRVIPSLPAQAGAARDLLSLASYLLCVRSVSALSFPVPVCLYLVASTRPYFNLSKG